MSELVEREIPLQILMQMLDSAREQGRIALVAGEAGIGKTSLLLELQHRQQPRLWWGACDALQTPHPLGPLQDIARDTGAAFAARLDGPRPALFDAVLADLRSALTPILIVIEDAHWADDATLDLLKFLGRRIGSTRALLAISYRDDEVGAGHPLRRVIGELPPALLTRIELAPLSPQGVATLARQALRAPAALHSTTQGNPFFVTELLRHGTAELPRTVQDLVLARFARLDPQAQAVLRLAAIVPKRVESALLDAVLAPSLTALQACFDAGLLRADAGTTVSFRHELARVAIESSLAPPVARALHGRVLQVLTDSKTVPLARLAHHAARAHDAAAIRRYAPAAADEAWARGATREAAQHYREALAQADPGAIDPALHRHWLDAYAEACQRIDASDEAIAARQQIEADPRLQGNALERTANLGRLAILLVYMARNAEADATSRRAIEMLEATPAAPAAARAAAYGTEAALRMLNRDCEASAAWSRKAIALAQESGDRQRLCGSLSTLGTALMFIDYEAGCRQMQEALDMALAEAPEPLHLLAANALLNLGSASGELLRYAAATPWLRRGMAYAGERELDSAKHYAGAWLALCSLHQGRWDEAGELAGDLSTRAGVSAISRMMALLALGRLRLRRGDPGVDSALDEALALAGASSTLQRIAPVRAARAEAAFARGDLAACAAEAQAALPLATLHRHACFIGELAFWLWRAGAPGPAPAGCAEPFAAQIDGRWQEAADAWAAMGCPYEQARALADGDASAQQQALALFEQLGATPAAEGLKKRLRDAGVRGLARGPRASTRGGAFGLTSRELQVLHLLCQGLRNAEIARQLSRSVRTVDHHLAAIFGKLGVESRAGAVQAAARAGLATSIDPRALQNGQSGGPN